MLVNEVADKIVAEMYSSLPTQWDRECLRSKIIDGFAALRRRTLEPVEAREALEQALNRLLWIRDLRNGKTSAIPQVEAAIALVDKALAAHHQEHSK